MQHTQFTYWVQVSLPNQHTLYPSRALRFSPLLFVDSRFLNIDYSALNGLWTSRFLALLESFMRDIEHAFELLTGFIYYAEQTLRSFGFAKHVIQASTASSHRVGKCIFEPSKQSRIRKSSFWSHRRSTGQWETALSSKERSRRVNCPMLVPYGFHQLISITHTGYIYQHT